jgi:hypothetical protein
MAYLDKDGYLIVAVGGKKYRQHRLVMERHIGRKLLINEVVHHINHIKTDNRIENLQLLSSHREHKLLAHPNAWNKGRVTKHTHKCIQCGKSFTTIRQRNRKCCSLACTQKNATNVAKKVNRKFTNCQIDKCTNPHLSKGMCRRHYYLKHYKSKKFLTN